jgi:hypothetical protein
VTSTSLGVADRRGNLLNHYEEPDDIAVGPERTLSRVESSSTRFVRSGRERTCRAWIRVPGPIEFSAVRPVPRNVTGRDQYRVGQRPADPDHATVWVATALT